MPIEEPDGPGTNTRPPKPKIVNLKPPKPKLVSTNSSNSVTKASSASLETPFVFNESESSHKRSDSSIPPIGTSLSPAPPPPASRVISPRPKIERVSTPLPEIPRTQSNQSAEVSILDSEIPPLDFRSDESDIDSPLLSKGTKSFEWCPPSSSSSLSLDQNPPPLPARSPVLAPSSHAPPLIPSRGLVDPVRGSAKPSGKLEDLPVKRLFSHEVNYRPPSCDFVLPSTVSKGINAVLFTEKLIIFASNSQVFAFQSSDMSPLWDISIDKVTCMTLSHNGKALWLGRSTGSVAAIDLESSQLLFNSISGHQRSVCNIWYDSNLARVLSLSTDGKLAIWENSESPTSLHRTIIGLKTAAYINGQLWVAKGRAISVFKPCSVPFLLTPVPIEWKPPVNTSATSTVGDISCISPTPYSGLVLCGHNNGVVSLYDASTLAPVYSVNTGIYGITCAFVRQESNQWWIGLKTGAVMVIKIENDRFDLIKQWNTGSSSFVKIITDGTLDGGEVLATLSDSGKVALWEPQFSKDQATKSLRDVIDQTSTLDNVKVQILSWNVDSCNPQSLNSNFILENCDLNTDILVFAFQEVVELDNKTKTAKKLISSKPDPATSQEYENWKIYLCNCMSGSFDMVLSKALVGLYMCVFVRHGVEVSNIDSALVKTGMGGLHGNKGGISVRMDVYDTSFCFINCHLAAGHSQVIQRNRDALQILTSPVTNVALGDMALNGGDGTRPMDHEVCFFFGDTNYRINTAREQAIKYIKDQNWAKLYSHDQLHGQMQKNPTFCLNGFREPEITFQPTYKFDRGRDSYDTSDKKRIPAWCDRILYRGKASPVQYKSVRVLKSDHRPVIASFDVEVRRRIDSSRSPSR